MRALVVYAHPSPDSLTHALYEAATAALAAAGHEVVGLDLYAEELAPAMSEAERRAYHSDQPIIDPTVARHAELVRWADTLVFVYPTWWMGLPAILKGWLERVLVPGVAFHLDPATNRVVSDLGASDGSSASRPTDRRGRRSASCTTAAGGRCCAALRMLCGRRCRTAWLALYSVDTATPGERDRFVARVEQRLSRL